MHYVHQDRMEVLQNLEFHVEEATSQKMKPYYLEVQNVKHTTSHPVYRVKHFFSRKSNLA